MSLHLESSSSLEQENLEAQRAAAEAIEIGRAALAQTVQQGEQLRRAEDVADGTQYAVDRAGRILRGMTWSGWVANLFTGDVPNPTGSGDRTKSSSNSASSWFHSSASSSVSSNSSPSRRTLREPPLTYEHVPEPCVDAAQAVQNYHANVLIYEQCETPEQRETSRLICDDMHRVAEGKVQALLRTSPSQASVPSEIAAFYRALMEDLQTLRKRQNQGPGREQHSSSSMVERHQSQAAKAVDAHDSPSSLVSSTPKPHTGVASNAARRTTPAELKQSQQQDEHLSILSQNLEELGNLAGSLNQSILHQNDAMDRLHDKSDSILEQSQRVTRRAERMTNRVSGGWFVPSNLRAQQPTFVSRVFIRYVPESSSSAPSTLLLGRMQGDVYLLSTSAAANAAAAAAALNLGVPAGASSVAVTFLLYRRGMFVGLKHEATNTWLGQNLLGSLACTATSMGTRDEWQLDEGGRSTLEDANGGAEGREESGSLSFTSTLLCASAGWGSGGYLYVRPRDQAVLIGGSTVDDKKQAARWTFQTLD